ncbi:MAG: nuclear transport factor 2 family protein [Chloroflexi bacterium]|nr:nuclear transport factor 2 family protein [Chloroflexota bacterium]
MLPEGKGFYIWKIPQCEQGDIKKITLEAYQAGLTHVLVKIANGIYDYNYDVSLKKDLVAPLSEELQKYGIKTWGWHYVFGDLPKEEVGAAIRQIRKIPLEGYVIDAESEYKGKYTPCRIFMNELRNALPDFPIALSSFRYPKYHNDLPWIDFLSKSDINMPQVYWEQAHNPGEQLLRSLNEFTTEVKPFRPIIPTGAAYGANGWTSTVEDVIHFIDTAVSLGLRGVNFWSWDYCRRGLPHLWKTIAAYDWPTAPNPPKDIVEELIDGINSQNITKILSLYLPDAVHINVQRTIQGQPALRDWYKLTLESFLKNALIEITNLEKSETTRKFSWKASIINSSQITGFDSIGLSNEKILYHYSSISN